MAYSSVEAGTIRALMVSASIETIVDIPRTFTLVVIVYSSKHLPRKGAGGGGHL